MKMPLLTQVSHSTSNLHMCAVDMRVRHSILLSALLVGLLHRRGECQEFPSTTTTPKFKTIAILVFGGDVRTTLDQVLSRLDVTRIATAEKRCPSKMIEL